LEKKTLLVVHLKSPSLSPPATLAASDGKERQESPVAREGVKGEEEWYTGIHRHNRGKIVPMLNKSTTSKSRRT
jgi:hypothetical protein